MLSFFKGNKLLYLVMMILALVFSVMKMMDTGRDLGQAETQVETLQGDLAVVDATEKTRSAQQAADDANFIATVERNRSVAAEFDQYRDEVTHHANTTDPGPDPLPADCALSDHKFGVLLTAYASTFERAGVSTDTGGDAAPAEPRRAPARRWLAGGVDAVQHGSDGAHPDYPQCVRPAGDGCAGSAGAEAGG